MWLRCELVKFGSPGDEEAFFQWIQRIRAVRQVRGEGRFILLHVPRRRISNDHLRELIALFHRYKVSMSQLAEFRGPWNEAWFAAPGSYWHRAVFEQ